MNIEEQLKDKLKEISEVLDAKTNENDEVGVLSGVSGVSLFQFYYSKFLDEDIHADKGAETITRAVEMINNGFSYPTFCTGIAGACWVLEVLKEEEFIELDEDILSSDLDAYLLTAMREDIKKENYDFLHGAMGYGYYFLKRYQNTTTQKSKDIYKKHIEELIQSLQQSSKENDYGVWWDSVLRKEEGLVGCNLSLSHGISSTINFLSRLAAYDDFREQVNILIQPTVKYLLHCKNKDVSLTSRFPNWILEETPADGNSRLAWCYGDLGVGISLLRAAEVLKDNALFEEALEVLIYSTERKDLTEAGIADAGICHGAFGVMHIYNYLYRKTEKTQFKEAADFWAEKALQFGNHKNGYAGYMVWRGAEEEKWRPEVSLLEGITGIGLSIISYLAPFETKWDECLLIG